MCCESWRVAHHPHLRRLPPEAAAACGSEAEGGEERGAARHERDDNVERGLQEEAEVEAAAAADAVDEQDAQQDAREIAGR